jgi:hypothetical protein
LKFSENNCNNLVLQNNSSCLGNKLVFNTNPGYNYLWTGPNNFTSTLQNPFIENVTASSRYNVIIMMIVAPKQFDVYVE